MGGEPSVLQLSSPKATEEGSCRGLMGPILLSSGLSTAFLEELLVLLVVQALLWLLEHLSHLEHLEHLVLPLHHRQPSQAQPHLPRNRQPELLLSILCRYYCCTVYY